MTDIDKKTRVAILGTGGRDYHNFNEFYRGNKNFEVVAFVAGAAEVYGKSLYGKVYPPELSGPLYPKGIPMHSGENLSSLIKELKIDQVDLCLSDLAYDQLMKWASLILTSGANFQLMSSNRTMIKAKKPVIAITAVRTGAGKSTTTRRVADILKKHKKRVVAIRHPMAYGDLKDQICQRYGKLEDVDRYKCTIEEREEYEPLLRKGILLYAGIDYRVILKEAEKEADVIIWDGGNNDPPFYKPDVNIVVADALRIGHSGVFTYPGEVNARMADVIVINKADLAKREDLESEKKNLRSVNPSAIIIEAKSEVTVDKPELIKGKRVVVVEDGPTVTHGGAPFAAGYVAAQKYGAAVVVDPRKNAVGSIKKAFEDFKHMKNLIPAMGYWKEQLKDLEDTINAVDCDSVVLGTPSDLTRFLSIDKPVAKVNYELVEIGSPNLEDIIVKHV